MTQDNSNLTETIQQDESRACVNTDATAEQVARATCSPTGNHTEDDADLFHRSAVIDQELPIGEIRRIEAIQDYKQPSMSPIPIVAKTPDAIYCLDGWQVIEEARQGHNETISCRVNFVADCTADDLAFEKVAVRTKTQGGIAAYSELVANTAKLQELLLLSAPGLLTNTHGGPRDQGDEQDSLPGEIARRLGKERKTILQYLSHSKYLNEETLRQLVEAEAPKKFFKDIHGAKGRIVAALQERRMPEADITARVSEAVAAMLTAYTSDRSNFTNAISEILLRYTGNNAAPIETPAVPDGPADPGGPATTEAQAGEEQPLPENFPELKPLVVERMQSLVQRVESAPDDAAFWRAFKTLYDFASLVYGIPHLEEGDQNIG